MFLSKNFLAKEFDCKCASCDIKGHLMDKDFIDSLQQLRALCDFEFLISSGLRCERHNKNVGGKEKSYHLVGRACDIICVDPFKRHELVRVALDMGLTVIIYKSFVHVDNRKTSALLLVG